MRQVWITKVGAPEVLQVKEAPDPTAGPGEVRIRTKAAGINFADLMARVGLYPDAPKLPAVVGYEVSGVVDQVGDGVTGFKAGDKVIAMPRFGGYTDTLVVSSTNVFHLPPTMSFEEGAAMPVVYLTAHHMMMFTGYLRPGSKVFIHSAAGGVGIAAIQLAKSRGCTIFGTASPGKHEFLRGIGVHHPIDSGTDYVQAVEAIAGKGAIDLVLDPVGGKSWTEGYELLAPCGRLVAFGFSAAAAGKKRNLFHAASEFVRIKKWSPIKLMEDNKTVSGTNMGHLFDKIEFLRPQLEDLLKMFETGLVKPRVDKTFPFAKAAEAHHFIHDRKAIGKVLLTPE